MTRVGELLRLPPRFPERVEAPPPDRPDPREAGDLELSELAVAALAKVALPDNITRSAMATEK